MSVALMDDDAARTTWCYGELADVIERYLPFIPPTGPDALVLADALVAFRRRCPESMPSMRDLTDEWGTA